LTGGYYFYISRNMEKSETIAALAALAALAHDTRLDVFRLLVEAGPQGLPVGAIGDALGVPPVPQVSMSDSLGGQA